MTRFNVVYSDSKGEIERKNLLASEVLDYFKSLPWQESFEDCLKTEDAVYDYMFIVYYTDAEQLEQSLDIEIFMDDENKSLNQNISFDVSVWYEKYIMKKVFFGLLGEKKEVKSDSIILENQDTYNTLKYLQSFVHLDSQYLKSLTQ